MFVEGLKASRGRKNLNFSMRCEAQHFVDVISLPQLEMHISKKSNSRVAFSVADDIIRAVNLIAK
jgi:hypothetical protein